MGKQKSTSGWVKKYLYEKKILDSNYKLTEKGIKIKNVLIDMEKEIKNK